MLQESLISLALWLVDTATNLILQIGMVFYESAIFILLGFAAAGLLREFISAAVLQNHFGGNNLRSVVYAALFGAPLPLCSCGVLPMALELRKKGASRPAVTSFLISTPETGVDSIALTYALMGPVMAVVRPVMAIASAVTAGLGMILVGRKGSDLPKGADTALAQAGEAADCGHDHEDGHGHGHGYEHGHDHAHSGAGSGIEGKPEPSGWQGRLLRVVDHGFRTLFDEIAVWIFIGLVLTGVLVALLPADFFSAALGLGSGLLPMLLMVLIGVPLYMCASASTPIAAALVATGLSPGAALVFLLTGPATNLATISVVMRLLGYTGVAIYLVSIVGVALLGGLALDAFIGEWVRDAIVLGGSKDDGLIFAGLKWLSVGVLALLILASYRRGSFTHGLADWRSQNRKIFAQLGRVHWAAHVSTLAQILGLGRVLPTARSIMTRQNRLWACHFGLTAAAGLALAALWPQVTVTVGPGQRGIIQRLGAITASDLEPGLYFHLPAPFGRGIAVDTGTNRQIVIGKAEDREEGLYLTGDENLVEIGAVVQYRVQDPVRALFAAEPAEELIRQTARGQLTSVVAGLSIDPLYSVERAAVEQAFEAKVKTAVAALNIGHEVARARLIYVHAPAEVHDAFRDVASSLEDQTQIMLEAEGRAVEVLAQARSEATRIRMRARAEALRSERVASGETRPFEALAKVFDDNAALTRQRLQLEALERHLQGARKLVNGFGKTGNAPDLWLGTEEGNALRLRNTD